MGKYCFTNVVCCIWYVFGVLTNVLVITVVLLHKKSTSHTNNVFLTPVCKLVRFG